MISPVLQRQLFQTANLEAVREALGVNEQAAREAARKRVLDERISEDQSNVPEIPKADPMRTEEDSGRRGRGGGGKGSSQEPGEKANPAESSLDFLA